MKELKQTICQRCGKPASVFYRESVNGKTREMCLCASCAAKEGVGKSNFHVPGFWDDDFFSAMPLFSDFFGTPVLDREAKCPRCGKTLRRIREDGRFGCSQCYELFGKDLDLKPFIGGGYKGKPLTAAPERDAKKEKKESPEQEIARLKEQLRQAIASEAYEKAAALRDEIRQKEDK